MEALKKLREQIESWGGDLLWKTDVAKIADEIERELSERYMKLPVDADGVPIHVGDAMDDGKVAKMVISDDGEHSVYVYKLPNVLHEIYCYETAHAKPDPVKELLEEFAASSRALEMMDAFPNPNNPRQLDYDGEFKGLIDEYAAKLREAMGGDAE